ncbi:hypothetical protein HIM_11547 [Hirsutella minnesotensis 3608]|uniref:Uncharacterized protein n=1 Tax=Hirsutella minnesotensis 3608 TaxID=1043627 RepID=A0A0F8A116_9HYPO|nr:hypothetical protein HIM_11547 [Hirsutella minnesotensis 3608]
MASSDPRTDPLTFFEENRYFCDEDASIGKLVEELEKQGIAESHRGLEIAKPKLLANSNVRPIIEPYLSRPDIRLCTSLGEDPNHRFVLSLEPGQKEHIIVHLWSPGSEAELYRSSHLDPPGLPPLKAAQASNGLLELAGAVLKKRMYSPVTVKMERGGIAVMDRRFCFRIVKGFTVTYDLHMNATELAVAR